MWRTKTCLDMEYCNIFVLRSTNIYLQANLKQRILNYFMKIVTTYDNYCIFYVSEKYGSKFKPCLPKSQNVADNSSNMERRCTLIWFQSKMEFMRNSAMAFLSCITCLQTQDKDDFDFEGNMITKWLPPEILELVFLELNINDLCSCSKTCVRWSLVISSLYKDKCKLCIQCLKSK